MKKKIIHTTSQNDYEDGGRGEGRGRGKGKREREREREIGREREREIQAYLVNIFNCDEVET